MPSVTAIIATKIALSQNSIEVLAKHLEEKKPTHQGPRMHIRGKFQFYRCLIWAQISGGRKDGERRPAIKSLRSCQAIMNFRGPPIFRNFPGQFLCVPFLTPIPPSASPRQGTRLARWAPRPHVRGEALSRGSCFSRWSYFALAQCLWVPQLWASSIKPHFSVGLPISFSQINVCLTVLSI